MKILICDPLGVEGVQLLKKQPGYDVDELPGLAKKDLLAKIGRYDALIVRSATRADREVIAAGKNLRVIARAGVGTDNIDVEAASQRGIVVTNTPDANTLAAAEHTMALLLAVCRHIPEADATVKSGEWGRGRFMGRQLYGKTLGIVGLGRIGVQVAQRAEAFGMKILAHDPYIVESRARELGLELISLPELLKRSDVVTLHTPSTDATRGLVSKQHLALMKKSALLINCARGDLVDEQALAEALATKQIAGAALDVFRNEPPAGSPLLGAPNLVLTPHLAASTTEAQAEVSLQIARQVIGVLSGERYENVLNMPFTGPFAEMKPYLRLASRVGSLSAQVLEGRITRIEWDFAGGPAEYSDAVETALLRGILQPVLGHEVNYVNAQRLAALRGLKLSRVEYLAEAAHSTIACRLVVGRKSRLVVGALLAREWPRIVQIDGYRLDADPTGDLLFTVSKDVPGVIGKIGTLLGKAGVNIAEWRLGRDAALRQAVTLVNLDSAIPQKTLVALRRLPAVLEAKAVRLGE
jgi:D-3-phosphoglycerate dehydrogenase / 2-oxoglutarate reductase